jgi:receptor protein-tyrosine kinase
MTDKTQQPLNLIERMAQRLAKQEGAALAAELAGRQSAIAEDSPSREHHFAKPVPEIGPKADDVRSQTSARAEPTAEPVRVRTSNDTSRPVHLDFRVLRQNGMITPDNMSSVVSNEFRAIKRKLLQKVRDPDTRVPVNNLVMITSSLPGEGKTFTSLNLALSLAAERGMQVLLLDADVIRPTVSNVFRSVPREGLTDLLSGAGASVTDVMCRCVEVPNLAVIFSGKARADSPELVSSKRMLDLCADLSTRYSDRIIVIDTPPVLASPEPATLASYVHQLIMVVAANQTDRQQLRTSLEAVSSCKNVSLLFNKAPKWDKTEYRAYYGYANAVAAPLAPSASS